MASIKQNVAQQRALNEINKAMDTERVLHEVLTSKRGMVVAMTFDDGVARSGRNGGLKIQLNAKDKEMQDLKKVLMKVHSRIAKEVRAKAKEFSIEFDTTDESYLSLTAKQKPANTEQPTLAESMEQAEPAPEPDELIQPDEAPDESLQHEENHDEYVPEREDEAMAKSFDELPQGTEPESEFLDDGAIM